MPSVVYSTKAWQPKADQPEGVLVYTRIGDGTDALVWLDREGRSVTESQLAVLRAAQCQFGDAPPPRLVNHHALVRSAIDHVVNVERSLGGQLGRPSGARFRTYERLKRYAEDVKGTLFEPQVAQVLQTIYRYPLRPLAVDLLNRQIRAGIGDGDLAGLCADLLGEGRLCSVEEADAQSEPEIICSLGLAAT